MINALDAPAEAACRELQEADKIAAAIPSRVPLGILAPDVMRLDADVKQITHAIRMAAYNAETTLARALDAATPASATKPTSSSAKPSPPPTTSGLVTANC